MLHDVNKLKSSLEQSLNRFKDDIQKLNTGKANIDTIQNIEVEAYGSNVALNTVGQVVLNDAINAVVTVWDKSLIPAVDSALRESSIGASVAIDKDVIRLKFNPLTGEDRVRVVKELKQVLEQAKIAVRQVRQEFMKKVQSLEGVSEDEQDQSEKSIQKEIDNAIKQLDELSNAKEESIMNV